jgi:hypothetical protein
MIILTLIVTIVAVFLWKYSIYVDNRMKKEYETKEVRYDKCQPLPTPNTKIEKLTKSNDGNDKPVIEQHKKRYGRL